MKRNALIMVGIVVLGGALIVGINQKTSVTSYVAKPETIEVEVTPDWAMDEDAVKAAQAVIKRKELEAEESRLVAEITERQNALDEVQKELGTYWRDPAHIKALIREVFHEEPAMAIEVARRESFGDFGMDQSKLTYSKDNPKWGVKAGQQEQSFCFFQIHAPVHDANAKRLGLEDYKTNVESCVKMARVIYDDAGGFYPWTEYHKILAQRWYNFGTRFCFIHQ